MRCPCMGTFLFLLRYRSVAHHSGASPNEVVLPKPLQVRGFGFYVHNLTHVFLFRPTARMRRLLIVAVRRRVAEEQPRERELLRDAVPIDLLRRNVQEDAVVVLVRVVQRTVRHHEEVLRGQTERVRGGGRDVGAGYVEGHLGYRTAIMAVTHTFLVYPLPIFEGTPRTSLAIMSQISGKQICAIGFFTGV